MSYAKTFRLNGVDLAPYIHEDGPKRTDTPVKGLPDEYTEDNVKHVDIRGFKTTLTVPFNPTTEEETRLIKTQYKSGVSFLTTYDTDVGADVTFTVEPSSVVQDPAIVEDGAVTLYQLSPLTFGVL